MPPDSPQKDAPPTQAIGPTLTAREKAVIKEAEVYIHQLRSVGIPAIEEARKTSIAARKSADSSRAIATLGLEVYTTFFVGLLVALVLLILRQRNVENHLVGLRKHLDTQSKLPEHEATPPNSIPPKWEGRIITLEQRSIETGKQLNDFRDELNQIVTAQQTLAEIGEQLGRTKAQIDRLVKEVTDKQGSTDEHLARVTGDVKTLNLLLQDKESEIAKLKREFGIAPVSPTFEAVKSSLRSVSTVAKADDTQWAREMHEAVAKEALALLDIVAELEQDKESDGAFALFLSTRFDPFAYPSELWPTSTGLKRALETARESAAKMAVGQGYVLVRPTPSSDRVDPNDHDVREQRKTADSALVGRVASLIRPGLKRGSKLLRAAWVHEYVIDLSSEATAMAPVTSLQLSAEALTAKDESIRMNESVLTQTSAMETEGEPESTSSQGSTPLVPRSEAPEINRRR